MRFLNATVVQQLITLGTATRTLVPKSLPTDLSTLQEITKAINASEVDIFGTLRSTIPSEIGLWTDLTVFNVAYNFLKGTPMIRNKRSA